MEGAGELEAAEGEGEGEEEGGDVHGGCVVCGMWYVIRRR